MSKHISGAWLGMLGKLVSAAGNRDASAWDQAEQVAAAHTELFNELRRMDEVQAELLEALENVEREHECLNWMKACEKRRGKGMLGIAVETDELALEWQSHEKSLQGLVNARRAAIARARGES